MGVEYLEYRQEYINRMDKSVVGEEYLEITVPGVQPGTQKEDE